ncbi:DUF427 domain-containing protein [Nitratireductor basaltis]|uniref:DUF427 domain-containing protein n=1 Tax=Nitratireductor basaltis TaxID=472175 RepID=A0A084U8C9_9HYPH|nr:DUF427 domain-containing protein [Nitratireductor basaltis]KFB09215.1 hypothetical protein EL18_00230 [Nitratireductor basaltis]
MSATSERISIRPYDGTVNIFFSDAVVASTEKALVLEEQGHKPVYYVPFEHIYFDFFRKSPTTTTCPFKGQASYWSVEAVGEAADDVLWSYETPHEDVRQIAGYGAFDPNKVDIEAAPKDSPRHVPEGD